jgi:hypothetical protein
MTDTTTDTAERLQHQLTDWRTRIDELLVQLDLGSLDLRDAVTEQLTNATNAGLAALAGLGDARDDLSAGVAAQRATVGDILRDLQNAFVRARESVERT